MADNTSTYKLEAAAIGSAAAAIDIRANGLITCVAFSWSWRASASGVMLGELSWNPVLAVTQNDTTSSIASITGASNAANDFLWGSLVVPGLSVVANAGERLYLNLDGPASALEVICHVYINDQAQRTPRARR